MPALMQSINTMSHEDKLRTMDALWTSIVSSNEGCEPPAWHGDLLAERRHLVETGEAKFVAWEDAKSELRGEFE